VERLCKDLNNAVGAIWPKRHDSRYESTHVLLLSWEDDDLGVIEGINRLRHVFGERFKYEVEIYEIPTTKPDLSLKQRIIQYLDLFDSKDTLLIVYYAGHGSPGRNPGSSSLWFA
jgi:hypothetical protein